MLTSRAIECIQKTLSGLMPSGTRDVSSSPVQLTMETIPDSEEQDCTMGEDEPVHLIQHPSSYTDENPPASQVNLGELSGTYGRISSSVALLMMFSVF